MCQRGGEMNYAHTFTYLQLDRCVQNGHLNTKTIGHLSFSYELLAITWISMYSGGHLELSKTPDRTFVSHFIPLLCCIMGRGRHQVWAQRGGNFYELHLTILLILVYWRKWCYSIFNPFYVILLQIFMWYYSSWEMVEPMSINSQQKWSSQRVVDWGAVAIEEYSDWIIVIPEPRFFFVCFCTLVLWFYWLYQKHVVNIHGRLYVDMTVLF